MAGATIVAGKGRGKVTREYTALIDPPYIAPAIVTPMQTPAMVSAPPPMPVAAPVTSATVP
jgi:pilus assembly protein FimV